MTKRILDISDAPARLQVSCGCIVIHQESKGEVRIPFEDIGVLVVSHPQVSYTQAVLSGLAESGGVFVGCNSSRLPVGMLLPLSGNHIQVTRYALQAAASLPTKKRLWKQIVQSKIKSQARLLVKRTESDHGLLNLAQEVKSGDPANVEAQAARRYWKYLFPRKSFHRDRDAPNENLLLNYGYAVVRAIVSRGICTAGLHPSLGLHHHNRSSTYCLADDLMEPLRAIVDRAAGDLVADGGAPNQLTRSAKQFMLEQLMARKTFANEQHNLFEISTRTASSLVNVFEGKARMLTLPEV